MRTVVPALHTQPVLTFPTALPSGVCDNHLCSVSRQTPCVMSPDLDTQLDSMGGKCGFLPLSLGEALHLPVFDWIVFQNERDALGQGQPMTASALDLGPALLSLFPLRSGLLPSQSLYHPHS